jgi:hypothetical protein
MPRRSKRDIFNQARPTVEALIASLRKGKDTEQADAVEAVLGLARDAVRVTEGQAALDAKLDQSFSIQLEYGLNVRAYENTTQTVTKDVIEGWEAFLAGAWEPEKPVRAPHGSGIAKTNASVRAPRDLIERVQAAADQMVADKGWPTTRGYKLNAGHVAAQWLAPEGTEAAAE